MVSETCFFQLRQLQRVRRSLDIESASTLVHAFVTSRVDYCNGLLVGAPIILMDNFQPILNAAARVVTRTPKYDPNLTRIRREDLHCLDVSDRITFKLCVSVFTCLHGLAPSYLSNLCRPLANDEGRRHLGFATRGQPEVPRPRLST